METTSAIVCDPAIAIAIADDRTMFYLKAGFHMIEDDRRPYCDLRSVIIWKPAFTSYLIATGDVRKDQDIGHDS